MGRMKTPATAIDALRRELGIDRLVLEIHDASFPADPDEDVGRGSPYSRGGRRFLAWLRTLGFDGVQLGPQGQTSQGNASPYDARLFGRDFLSLPLGALVERGLLAEATLARLVAARPGDGRRVEHLGAWTATEQALDEAHRAAGGALDREGLAQLILGDEHRRLRETAGLRLYGDLQIGMAPDDALAFRSLFLPGMCLGAPPSRTNPDGQPWGYPVYDPRRRREVIAFLRARARGLAADFDGIRIDHPHGLVCPWVHAQGTDVALGGRLHESPDVPDLAPFAIARMDQLDLGVPRHADGRVRALDDAQVARYAELLDVVIEEAGAEVVCEVLSTLPYPLARVMERHGLGRFRVTQKLALEDPADVYRIENAAPADWIMAGNHDTPPLWRLAPAWPRAAWGRYLAGLLVPAAERQALEARIAAEPGELVHALFAAMFASAARNVLVFFPDLLGLTEVYNVPGTVNDDNWKLRVPPDYEARHREAAARGLALDVERALAMAARARRLLRSRS
jgi:4-alpha-glucanotransferase